MKWSWGHGGLACAALVAAGGHAAETAAPGAGQGPIAAPARSAPAQGRAFWAFQPVRRPPVPHVRAAGFTVHNPVDAFVLARLQDKALAPAPPASKEVLIR